MKTCFLFSFIVLSGFCSSFSQSSIGNELRAILKHPGDTIFIEDRKKLEKLPGVKCNDTVATLTYRSKNREMITILLNTGLFVSKNHRIDLADTVFKVINNEKRVDYTICRNLIDGRNAYGIDCRLPEIELKGISIRWNNRSIAIPDSAFMDLFEPHICAAHGGVEAYLAGNKEYLYLYLSGSDGAGSYSVKWVFDRNRYVTRIVTTIECTDGYNFLDGMSLDCEE